MSWRAQFTEITDFLCATYENCENAKWPMQFGCTTNIHRSYCCMVDFRSPCILPQIDRNTRSYESRIILMKVKGRDGTGGWTKRVPTSSRLVPPQYALRHTWSPGAHVFWTRWHEKKENLIAFMLVCTRASFGESNCHPVEIWGGVQAYGEKGYIKKCSQQMKSSVPFLNKMNKVG